MKSSLRFLLLLCWLLPALLSAQISAMKLKLQLMPDGQYWGVYVKPIDSVFPSPITITAAAQVTVVMPKNYGWTGLQSFSGSWVANATVNGPIENPTKKYESFGLTVDLPQIVYKNGQETLLFKFKRPGACPDSLYLLENTTDPFDQLPNSMNNNPGNYLGVFDLANPFFDYLNNYAPSAWNCHDNDGDYVANALEDTNGNGQWDPGVDASNLNEAAPGLNLKLQLIEANKWGVYVKPDSTLFPGPITITVAAQVTVVMPLNYAWNGQVNVSGSWSNNATVHGPAENPTKSYVSFGLAIDLPQIVYQNGEETLLFTFMRPYPCPDSIYLIDNETDPFNQLPNSVNSSPGNELAVFDPGNGNGYNIYAYHDNYSLSAWSCHDCDGDGILNAHEDTNGNGVYDANVEDLNNNGILDPGEDVDGDGYLDPDVSQLCNPCDPFHPTSAAMEQIGNGDVACANGLGNAAYFKVNIEGGWQPYTVTYTDGTNNFVEPLYYSGDSIGFVPTQSVVLDLVSIVDSFGCLLDTALTGDLNIGVGTPAYFSNDPDDITLCFGNDTVFVATASIPQGTFSFGWQYSDDLGLTWVDVSFWGGLFSHSVTGAVSSGTDVLTISNVAGMYGRRFRATANAPGCSAVYSNFAILNIQGPLSVHTHPTPVTECSGNSTSFIASFNNPGVPGSTIYRWQVSADGGITWFNLSNVGVYNGTATTQLSVSNVAGLHNICYRLSARTSTCDIMFTNSACITVEGYITVTDHPDDVTLCAGEASSFTATATIGTSGTFSHQWQVSSDNGTNWSDIGANTDGSVYTNFTTITLNVSNVSGLYGRCYRLAFSTIECNRVYSNRACLRVEGPISITDQPDDVYQCSGEAVFFAIGTANASTQDTTIFYQWQESTDGGTTWTDIVNDTLYNLAQTNQLSVGNTTGFDDNQYRCVISTITCAQLISDPATLHIEGPLTVVDEPDNIIECSGSGVAFSATISNGGPGTLVYQWEVSSDGGVTWSNLANDGNHSGVTTTTLSIADVAGMFGYWFRMRYRTTNCNANWTNYAILTINVCQTGCLKLKLQLLPDHSGWAVMAKPSGSFVPSENAMTTAGRVTLVAPANFVLDGFSNSGGTWSPTNVTENLPGHPGRKYITFELQPQGGQGTAIPYAVEQATALFQFAKTGPCPDSLYLLENLPAGMQPNRLDGFDGAGATLSNFEYCGVYARKAWRCEPPTSPGGPVIVIVETDTLSAPQNGAADRDANLPEGKTAEGQWFSASPNPAGGFVNITVSKDLADGRPTLTLWDLQGKKRLETMVENAATQLDLGGLPAGVYLISLAQNGRVVERKKIVKQ